MIETQFISGGDTGTLVAGALIFFGSALFLNVAVCYTSKNCGWKPYFDEKYFYYKWSCD